MSFQAYLDTIKKNTGKSARELIALAQQRGFTADTKASDVLTWLKDEYGLGRGHGMALVHVLKHGEIIDDKHVGTDGTHSDPSHRLDLD